MALALDGTATGTYSSGTTVVSGTLTTTSTNDVIIALVYTENDPGAVVRTVSSVTATGLTFTSRGGITNSNSPVSGSYCTLQCYWAPATSTFSGTVTANLSGVPDDAEIVVFGVSGANTSTPFDTNAAMPATRSLGSGGAPITNSWSTSNANDFIFAAVGLDQNQTAIETVGAIAGTTATIIAGTVSAAGCSLTGEYRVVSATQSSKTAAFGTSVPSGQPYLIYADAIVQASAAAGLPPGQQSFTTGQPDQNALRNAQLSSWVQPGQLLLIGKDQFNPGEQSYDTPPAWLAPERFAQWRTWQDRYKLPLIGQDQLPPGIQNADENRNDLPPVYYARPTEWWRSWTDSYKLTLIGQDRLPPGVQNADEHRNDLPPAWYYTDPWAKLRTWTWQYNPLLNVVPPAPVGAQLYARWADPQDGFAQWRTWTGSYNLNLIGKDQFPAGKQLNYLPAGVTWRPDSPQQNLLNTVLVPIVVGALPPGKQVYYRPYDPQDPWAQLRSFLLSYNVLLYPGQDQFPVGAQWDELPPYAPRRGIEFNSQYILGTLLVPPGLPPGQQLYERPRFFFLM